MKRFPRRTHLPWKGFPVAVASLDGGDGETFWLFSKGCPVELAANGETFLEKGFAVAAMLARAANRKHGSDGETFLENR